jgi:two-component system C4-dicarboxylate transport response regulator DctD
VRPRYGKFEHGRGGTILLDEIGSMPFDLQAKFLRVLQERVITRLGSNEMVPLDVRFIAISKADLEAEVAAGRFRADLFYRLNVHRIHLPPLRERGDDAAMLLTHFVARYASRTGIEGVSDAAREVLLQYPFPGNVRQLEHVVQRAVAVARGPLIEAADLPEELFETPPASARNAR